MSGPRDEDGRNAADVQDEALDIENEDDGGASADPDAGDDDEGSSDTGEDGDHPGGEDALGGDEGPSRQGQAEVRERRGNPEFGRLRQERREAREKAERLERELAEVRASVPRNYGPDPAQQLAERRKAELDYAREQSRLRDDPAIYLETARRHDREDVEQRLGSLQFQMADTGDRASYHALCATDPLAAKYRDKVEQRLREERSRGVNFPRETVLNFVIGDESRKNAVRALERQRREAAPAVRREAVRTPSGSQRSDVGRSQPRGDSKEARRRRVEQLQNI